MKSLVTGKKSLEIELLAVLDPQIVVYMSL